MSEYMSCEHKGVRFEIELEQGFCYYTRWTLTVHENGSKWGKTFCTRDQAVRFLHACTYVLDEGIQRSLFFDASCLYEGIAA